MSRSAIMRHTSLGKHDEQSIRPEIASYGANRSPPKCTVPFPDMRKVLQSVYQQYIHASVSRILLCPQLQYDIFMYTEGVEVDVRKAWAERMATLLYLHCMRALRCRNMLLPNVPEYLDARFRICITNLVCGSMIVD